MSDDELAQLRRLLEADPNAPGLSRRFEQALLRAGREDELRERLRRQLTCEFRYSEHPRDPEDDLRHPRCARCDRDVTLISQLPEVFAAFERGLKPAGLPACLDELIDHRLREIKTNRPPDPIPDCFVLANDQDIPEWGLGYCRCLTSSSPRFHRRVQDERCAPWKGLLRAIDQAVKDQREEFAPFLKMSRAEREQIVALPPSIARLKHVRRFILYGSRLESIPPEIAGMEQLEYFDPYTSGKLHWYPYEITRCPRLVDSRVSTRTLYGNSKNQAAFPDLTREKGPVTKTCSRCDGPLKKTPRQAWISLRVGTDVLPLLINACSEACLERLPVHTHTGGPKKRKRRSR